jgi:hypothetical protein
VNAETVDSWAAARVKGSSPLEVRKTFSMVLLEVRLLLHTPVMADTFYMVVESIRFRMFTANNLTGSTPVSAA